MRALILSVITLFATLLTISLVQAASKAEPAAKAVSPEAAQARALVKERCVKCHTLTRIKKHLEHTPGEHGHGKGHGQGGHGHGHGHGDDMRAWWETTVTRMKGHGATLSDEEKALVVDYLATTAKPKDL